MVDGHAILERVRAAGVGGHVAADGAGPLAATGRERSGSRCLSGALRQMHVDHARLDDGVAVAEVDFEDPLHPRQRDHHAAADRQAAAGQAGARPARHERHVVFVAQLDDRDDLLGRCRERRRRPGMFFSIV